MADTWEDWMRQQGGAGGDASPPYADGAPPWSPPPPSNGGYDGSGIGNTGRPRGTVQPNTATDFDWGDIEKQLRDTGGGLYDPSDLEGIKRNTSYTDAAGNPTGMSMEQALKNQSSIYGMRRGPQTASAQRTSLPGSQFDDPYSNMLEQIAKSQMGEVRSNPGLDQLMAFLQQQFTDLSTNPGYNPAEQAMLRTQVFEPIEANRTASKQRALERTQARGFAPSSGLQELDLQEIDRAADRNRTVADRDLAIAGLDRRDRDLSRALDLGQLQGLTIPKGQRGEEIGLANLLYQMPRTALQDAMSVISGSPSSGDAFSQALQLLQQQYGRQDASNANNAALFAQLGQILAGMFR